MQIFLKSVRDNVLSKEQLFGATMHVELVENTAMIDQTLELISMTVNPIDLQWRKMK